MADHARHQTYLDRLQKTLREASLDAKILARSLVARNSSVSGTTAVGAALCPGLEQQVALRMLEGHGLWWCWVWKPLKPALRGETSPPPEYEPLCPADDIEEAARRIAAVLALGDGDSAT